MCIQNTSTKPYYKRGFMIFINDMKIVSYYQLIISLDETLTGTNV